MTSILHSERPHPAPARRQLRRDLTLSVLLAAGTLLLYARTAWFPFLDFDDDIFVNRNEEVLRGLTLHGIWYAWTTGIEGNWTPLTMMSWMLDVTLWGKEASVFHTVSVLFHAANTVLVFWLLFLLTGKRGRSFVVAILFGIHPLHVESVVWIAERRDVLFLFWTLICLLFYRCYAMQRSVGMYFAVTCAFLLALFSKSMAVTVPLLMLCLDYWPLQRWKKEADDDFPFQLSKWISLAVEKLPWLALSLLTGIITIFTQKQAGATALNLSISFTSKCINALIALCWYIEKTFWPVQLCILYEHPENNWDGPRAFVSAIVLLSISCWVVWNCRKRPYLLTGWNWYLITLLPVVGLLQVGIQSYADRYSYLPQIGLGWMIVWQVSDWLEKVPQARRVQFVIATLFALMFGGMAIGQIGTWRDAPSVWRHGLAVEPDGFLLNLKVGEWELVAKNWPAAEQRFLKVIEVKPGLADAWLKLGATYEHQGDLTRAVNAYQHLIKLDPSHNSVYKHLGRVYQQQGNLDLAMVMLVKGIEVDKTDPDIRNRLGFLYGGSGDIQSAMRMFEEAARVAPDDVLSRINLGMALIHLKNPELAVTHLRHAIELDPQSAAAHSNLAIALEQLGQQRAAIGEYVEALRLNPDDASTRQRLDALKAAVSIP